MMKLKDALKIMMRIIQILKRMKGNAFNKVGSTLVIVHYTYIESNNNNFDHNKQ